MVVDRKIKKQNAIYMEEVYYCRENMKIAKRFVVYHARLVF
jgi:hypothetical protein